MSTETQSKQILAHLKTGRTLTAIEALNKFQCFRLAARICDLKQDGHDISKRMKETAEGTHVAEYFLA